MEDEQDEGEGEGEEGSPSVAFAEGTRAIPRLRLELRHGTSGLNKEKAIGAVLSAAGESQVE
jgi:hypothetical protein